MYINKWFRTLSETDKFKNLPKNDEKLLGIKILNSYDDSKSGIEIDEKQSDFNFINKPNILDDEKSNKFDHHHDILKTDNKESQIANQVHENHFKTFRNSLDVRFDVMNKNFIRAVKRELKCIYSEYLKNKGLRNSKCSLVSNNESFA